MRAPFCVLGTPRSRTTWLSRFLCCEHEPSVRFAGPEDIPRYFTEGRGAVDSMLTLRWRDVLAVPGIRVVAVERPLGEVIASAKRAGMPPGTVLLQRLYAALDELRSQVIVIPYKILEDPFALCLIQNYLTYQWPTHEWLDEWMNRRVEPDMMATMRAVAANAEGLRRLYG